jgi:VIT1/CCC1 family predicted Fe2+/Mn2+ transporter
MKTAKTLSWIIALAGLWEIVAPFVFGMTAASAFLWDAIIVGLALLVFGVWAALANTEETVKYLNWINAVLGLWLIIAPFVLTYSNATAAMWNDIIIGLVALVLGVWAAMTVGSHGQQPMGHGGQA